MLKIIDINDFYKNDIILFNNKKKYILKKNINIKDNIFINLIKNLNIYTIIDFCKIVIFYYLFSKDFLNIYNDNFYINYSFLKKNISINNLLYIYNLL